MSLDGRRRACSSTCVTTSASRSNGSQRVEDLPISAADAERSTGSPMRSTGFDADAPAWQSLGTILLDRTRIAARIAVADVGHRAQPRASRSGSSMNFLRVQPRGQGAAGPAPARPDPAAGRDRRRPRPASAAGGRAGSRRRAADDDPRRQGPRVRCVHLPGPQPATPCPSSARRRRACRRRASSRA